MSDGMARVQSHHEDSRGLIAGTWQLEAVRAAPTFKEQGWGKSGCTAFCHIGQFSMVAPIGKKGEDRKADVAADVQSSGANAVTIS